MNRPRAADVWAWGVLNRGVLPNRISRALLSVSEALLLMGFRRDSDLVWRAWVPDARPRLWRGIALGFVMAGLAALIRAALAEPLGSDLPFITCFPALIAAAIWGGFAGGL